LTTEKKRRLIIDVLFIGVILFLVYFFMKYIAIWTLPFLIGLVAAIVLQKPVNFLTAKTKLPRTFWSVLLVIAVLLSLFGIIGLLIWYFVSEAGNLADWLMGFVPDITATFENVSKWFSKFSNKMPEGVAVAMQGAPGMIVESLAGGVADFATAFAENFLTKGPGILITVIFSVVSSCYIIINFLPFFKIRHKKFTLYPLIAYRMLSIYSLYILNFKKGPLP